MTNPMEPATTVWSWVRRRGIEIAGWVLIAAGFAALVLPGPGLLCLVAGLALLATRYAWAERLLKPVTTRAFRTASQGVQTWPRIAASALGGLALIAVGVVWGVGIAVPGWWPVSEGWWLPGGWGTGVTLIGSGAFVLGMIVYSYHRFHGHPLMEPFGASPAETPARSTGPTTSR